MIAGQYIKITWGIPGSVKENILSREPGHTSCIVEQGRVVVGVLAMAGFRNIGIEGILSLLIC